VKKAETCWWRDEKAEKRRSKGEGKKMMRWKEKTRIEGLTWVQSIQYPSTASEPKPAVHLDTSSSHHP